jgi:hypothetical protein
MRWSRPLRRLACESSTRGGTERMLRVAAMPCCRRWDRNLADIAAAREERHKVGAFDLLKHFLVTGFAAVGGDRHQRLHGRHPSHCHAVAVGQARRTRPSITSVPSPGAAIAPAGQNPEQAGLPMPSTLTRLPMWRASTSRMLKVLS